MKINKLLMAGVLSLGVLGNSTLPVFAATGSYGSSLEIEVRNTTMDVTVPATLPMIFAEDGSNVLPDNWTVKNNSKTTKLYVSRIAVDAGNSGWKVVDDTVTPSNEYDNTKVIKLKMGKRGSEKLIKPVYSERNAEGLHQFANTDIVINPEQSETLSIQVERPRFTNSIANSKAFDLTIEFDVKSE